MGPVIAEMAGVADDSSISEFAGAELALADTVILLMKVMSMHGIIDSAAIVTVLADLEQRYRQQNLRGAAAMADYLRQHSGNADRGTLVRRQALLNDTPPEPA
jgi:hypothetical protein